MARIIDILETAMFGCHYTATVYLIAMVMKKGNSYFVYLPYLISDEFLSWETSEFDLVDMKLKLGNACQYVAHFTYILF